MLVRSLTLPKGEVLYYFLDLFVKGNIYITLFMLEMVEMVPHRASKR